MELVLTLIAYASLGVLAYYMGMFLLSLATTWRKVPRGDHDVCFAIVVPARDESVLIGETVRRLRALRGPPFAAFVLDDGSTDGTAEEARSAAGEDPRVEVISRDPAIAGRGKGDVLNDAYRRISALVVEDDARFGGRSAADVVLVVVDADGWLEPHALEVAAPYYADPRVAGLQLPVRTWNSRDGFLTLMQDIEFIGLSVFVQASRDVLGSVGLGGNGQFTRLSALQDLGAAPWTDCLTEDMELGLSLVERGWRNRFCLRAAVSQQALGSWRPLLRQRTRWMQGHYSCWQHLPALWRAPGLRWWTRIDLTLYLTLVALAMAFWVQFTVGIVATFAGVSVTTHFLSFISDPVLEDVVILTMTFAPLAALVVTYQRFALEPMPVWMIPGVLWMFPVYCWTWTLVSSLRALARLATGRGSWVKSPRTPISPHALAAQVRALDR